MRNHVIAGLQMPSWHDGGLFMGMHWLWWGAWVLTIGLLGWAFVRLARDRANVNRRFTQEEVAEEALRKRFAVGDIDEEEYMRKVKVLRETMLGG